MDKVINGLFYLTFIVPESTIYMATISLFGEELLMWSIVLHLVTIFIMLLLKINIEISDYNFKFESSFISFELG